MADFALYFYNLGFWLTGIAVVYWVIRTYLRGRQLHLLRGSIENYNLVRIDGLLPNQPYTRDYVQGLVRQRASHSAVHVKSLHAAVHILKETTKIGLPGKLYDEAGLHFKLHAATNCRVDVYFGVQQDATEKLLALYAAAGSDKLPKKSRRKKSGRKQRRSGEGDAVMVTVNPARAGQAWAAPEANSGDNGNRGKGKNNQGGGKAKQRQSESSVVPGSTPGSELFVTGQYFQLASKSFGPTAGQEVVIPLSMQWLTELAKTRSLHANPVVIHVQPLPRSAPVNTAAAASGDREVSASTSTSLASTAATLSAQMQQQPEGRLQQQQQQQSQATDLKDLPKGLGLTAGPVSPPPVDLSISELLFVHLAPLPDNAEHKSPAKNEHNSAVEGSGNAADNSRASVATTVTSNASSNNADTNASNTGLIVHHHQPTLLEAFLARLKFDTQMIKTSDQMVEAQDLFGLNDETGECTVCLTDPKDIVLLPCRHVCICNSCRANVQKCPVCRSPIEQFLRFVEDLEATLAQETTLDPAPRKAKRRHQAA